MDAEHKKEYWQRMLPNLVLLIIVVLPLFLFCGCTLAESQKTQEETRVIRIVTDYREEELGYQQLQIFAQTISEKSNNTMEVKLYATGEWSTEESFVEYLDVDAVELACLSLETAIDLQPMYEIYKQPYLFSDLQAVENYLTGTTAENALQQLPQEYYGVGYVANGYGFWLQGTLYDHISYGMVKHLAEINELEDAAVYDVRAVYHLHPLIASQDWWETLTAQEQQWIAESFQDSLKSIFIHQKEIAPKRLLESGASVYQMLPVELNGITEQWLNQRETYFSSHNDSLTAYWRPMGTTIIMGEGI